METPKGKSKLGGAIKGKKAKSTALAVAEEEPAEDETTGLMVSAVNTESTAAEESGRREVSLFNEVLEDPSLRAVIDLPLGLQYFRKYAQSSGDADLVLFYFEAEKYKKDNMSRHLRVKAAQNIRKKFLTTGAEFDIDIDPEIKSTAYAACDAPRFDSFEEAQVAVWDLLENDVFPEFIENRAFEDFVNETMMTLNERDTLLQRASKWKQSVGEFQSTAGGHLETIKAATVHVDQARDRMEALRSKFDSYSALLDDSYSYMDALGTQQTELLKRGKLSKSDAALLGPIATPPGPTWSHLQKLRNELQVVQRERGEAQLEDARLSAEAAAAASYSSERGPKKSPPAGGKKDASLGSSRGAAAGAGGGGVMLALLDEAGEASELPDELAGLMGIREAHSPKGSARGSLIEAVEHEEARPAHTRKHREGKECGQSVDVGFTMLKEAEDEMDQEGGDAGWNKCCNKAGKYTIYRKKPPPGSTQVVIRARMALLGVAPVTAAAVLCNDKVRAGWDVLVKEYKVLQTASETPAQDYIYIHTKGAMQLQDRTFIQFRTVFHMTDGSIMILYQGTVHGKAPVLDKAVPADTALSGFIIRKTYEDEDMTLWNGGCEVFWYSHTDPKGTVPIALFNAYMSRAPAKWYDAFTIECDRWEKQAAAPAGGEVVAL